MGELEIARMTGAHGIERLVVTKRLRLDLVGDERAALMLVDEARVAASLYHRNIVQVLDVVVEPDHLVLVLEYVPSVNLAQLLDAIGGPLSYSAAATIALEVAAGLAYTHDRTDDAGVSLDIIHRDVSLPNVLIGDHGHVKLTDFGIAKARSRLHVTRSAAIKGKLGYMAPEQIRGGSIDRRADLFGLGVVLYELTTGVPMFTTGSDYETMQHIMDGEFAPPRDARADYPDALDRVIRRAVASDPVDRYATASDLATAIRVLTESQGWRTGPRELEALVAEHLPPGDPPWRRDPQTSTTWLDRTTRRRA